MEDILSQRAPRPALPRRLRDDGWWLVHSGWQPSGTVTPFPGPRDGAPRDRRCGEHRASDRTSEAGHAIRT